MAVGELGLTLMEYWDLTLYELTAMMAGYNVRWEEEWKRTRLIYSILYNSNGQKKKKSPTELMPLPSEAEDIAFQKYISGIKAEMNLTKGKGRQLL